MKLRDASIQTMEAENGRRALEILDGLAPDRLPDLILLDLNMPVMSGDRFLLELRARGTSSLAGLPVLLTTGTPPDEIDPAVLAQVHGSLRKPYTAKDLLAQIARIVG